MSWRSLPRFKPGDIVPRSGVYRVTHQKHRPSHEAILLKGQKFPECHQCAEQVSFQTVQYADSAAASLPDSSPALLLVEHEPTVSETLQQILEQDGYEVTTAHDYADAVGMLKHKNFDVVLTELDLDTNSAGIHLARRIRSLRPTPALIFSAADPTEDKLRAVMRLRINYVVFKPIDLAELRLALARTISRLSVERQLAPFW